VKKILLVDDDPLILLLYQQALKNAGYELITASNAKEALSKFASSPPDLIILDVMMPGMGGLTALREMNKTSPGHCPVIVIAGGQQQYETTRLEAIHAGAVGFLSKPFSPAQLLAELQKHLPPGETRSP
jgi:two-component system chemotaxis response regulator CheY